MKEMEIVFVRDNNNGKKHLCVETQPNTVPLRRGTSAIL